MTNKILYPYKKIYKKMNIGNKKIKNLFPV